jgi:hypothetical protein
MKPTPFRHVASHCPRCRQILNGTVDPQGRGAPRPGDLTVCAGCGTILRFGPKLALTGVTPDQVEALPPETAKELLAAKDRYVKSRTRRLLTAVPRKVAS